MFTPILCSPHYVSFTLVPPTFLKVRNFLSPNSVSKMTGAPAEATALVFSEMGLINQSCCLNRWRCEQSTIWETVDNNGGSPDPKPFRALEVSFELGTVAHGKPV